MRCGNCKGSHGSVGEVRDCHSNAKESFGGPVPPSEKQMSLAQALGRERVRLPVYAALSEEEYRLHISELTRANISGFIKEMLKQPHLDGMNSGDLFNVVITGRYALKNEEDDDVRFYLVAGKEPRFRRLYELTGAPGDFRQTRIYRPNKILARIAADPVAAFALYGMKVGKCGVCHSPLTQKHTRERGIGDICYGKMTESA